MEQASYKDVFNTINTRPPDFLKSKKFKCIKEFFLKDKFYLICSHDYSRNCMRIK